MARIWSEDGLTGIATGANKPKKGKKMKTIGKCSHCGDPIYDFQEITHSGCNVKQVLSKDEDGIWCPRCGEVFHDEDIDKHPEDYYTCPTCFTIEHQKCRNLGGK